MCANLLASLLHSGDPNPNSWVKTKWIHSTCSRMHYSYYYASNAGTVSNGGWFNKIESALTRVGKYLRIDYLNLTCPRRYESLRCICGEPRLRLYGQQLRCLSEGAWIFEQSLRIMKNDLKIPSLKNLWNNSSLRNTPGKQHTALVLAFQRCYSKTISYSTLDSIYVY